MTVVIRGPKEKLKFKESGPLQAIQSFSKMFFHDKYLLSPECRMLKMHVGSL